MIMTTMYDRQIFVCGVLVIESLCFFPCYVFFFWGGGGGWGGPLV